MRYFTEEEGYPSCYGVRETFGRIDFNSSLNPDRGPGQWDGNSFGAFRLPFNYQPIWQQNP